MNLLNKLNEAASIDRMGTDSLSHLNRIDRNIDARIRQVEAGLISESEAVQLVKTSCYYL